MRREDNKREGFRKEKMEPGILQSPAVLVTSLCCGASDGWKRPATTACVVYSRRSHRFPQRNAYVGSISGIERASLGSLTP